MADISSGTVEGISYANVTKAVSPGVSGAVAGGPLNLFEGDPQETHDPASKVAEVGAPFLMFTIPEPVAALEGVERMETQPGSVKRKHGAVSPLQDIQDFKDPGSPAGPDPGSDTSRHSDLVSGQEKCMKEVMRFQD